MDDPASAQGGCGVKLATAFNKSPSPLLWRYAAAERQCVRRLVSVRLREGLDWLVRGFYCACLHVRLGLCLLGLYDCGRVSAGLVFRLPLYKGSVMETPFPNPPPRGGG